MSLLPRAVLQRLVEKENKLDAPASTPPLEGAVLKRLLERERTRGVPASTVLPRQVVLELLTEPQMHGHSLGSETVLSAKSLESFAHLCQSYSPVSCLRTCRTVVVTLSF